MRWAGGGVGLFCNVGNRRRGREEPDGTAARFSLAALSPSQSGKKYYYYLYCVKRKKKDWKIKVVLPSSSVSCFSPDPTFVPTGYGT